jgi:AraC-like DNA-binding protein
MEFINIAFHTISFLLAFLAASVLLLFNQERKYSNRLLAYVLIILAFQNMMNIFIITHLVYNVPWLLRFFAPFTFLIGPFLYIYIRSVLNNESKFMKQDWLLFIPAVLVLINFIPFYLLSNDEKILYLEQNFFNKTSGQDSGKGFIPCIVYNIIRICWCGLFVFIGFKQIYSFKKDNSKDIVAKNKTLLNWLFTFNCLLGGILITMLLKIFIPTIKSTHITIADIMLGGTILYICLSLFIRPQILYGVYHPLPNNSKDNTKQNLILKTNLTDTEIVESKVVEAYQKQQLDCKNKVEAHFSEKVQFLQPDYSLNHLVLDTHIPRYILSAFINREYGMSFREFLNRKKVEFIIANYSKPEWKQYTLEAIAFECGYSSRTTFIKNFKEITGKTPSEFFKATPK